MQRRPWYIYDRIPREGTLKPLTFVTGIASPSSAWSTVSSDGPAGACLHILTEQRESRSFCIVDSRIKYSEDTKRAIATEVKRLTTASDPLLRPASPSTASHAQVLREWKSVGNPTSKGGGFALGYARMLAG